MASPFFLEIRFLVCISVEIIFSLAITCRFYRFILKWRYQLGIKYQKEEDFIMDIDVLKKCGKNVTYKRGQVICQEGEIGHSMFILLQGNADITINSFSDQAQNLGTLQEGSFFGEMSLLDANRVLPQSSLSRTKSSCLRSQRKTSPCCCSMPLPLPSVSC